MARARWWAGRRPAPIHKESHARTIRQLPAFPWKLDEAVTAFESNELPQYKEQNGFKGFTLMVNRKNGKMIGVSFWENESDIAASDELLCTMAAAIDRAGRGAI